MLGTFTIGELLTVLFTFTPPIAVSEAAGRTYLFAPASMPLSLVLSVVDIRPALLVDAIGSRIDANAEPSALISKSISFSVSWYIPRDVLPVLR